MLLVKTTFKTSKLQLEVTNTLIQVLTIVAEPRDMKLWQFKREDKKVRNILKKLKD